MRPNVAQKGSTYSLIHVWSTEASAMAIIRKVTGGNADAARGEVTSGQFQQGANACDATGW